MISKNIIVNNNTTHLRVDHALSELLNVSRNKIQKYILANQVFQIINNEHILVTKNSRRCSSGDTYEVIISADRIYMPEKIHTDLNIVYEDEFLLVINKPDNLVVHPGHGTKNDTLVDIITQKYSSLYESINSYRPGIVHRLDKNTTGLMVIAKNDTIQQTLSEMIAKKEIIRKYLTITQNIPKDHSGKISNKIAPSRRKKDTMSISYNRGKIAVTEYKIIHTYENNYSIIECHLLTGRTHQIRLHMQYIGCPILGDKTYGIDSDLISRQALHSYYMFLKHPITGKNIELECPLPEDMQNVIQSLQ